MWVLIGLGNPGIKYKYSRHNIGFLMLDYWAKAHDVKWKSSRMFPSYVGETVLNDERIILAKPTTYMNCSGIAVGGINQIYSIVTDKMLVIVDDVSLPWGKVRLRKQGSSGGHNGLESIIQELKTTEFPRLRIGIGMGDERQSMVSHVLGRFNKEEKLALQGYYELMEKIIPVILEKDIETAMSLFN